MSARNYAILWIGARSGSGGGGFGTAQGGNVLTKTQPHKLDGPEHLVADDTTLLDATAAEHGLMAKLSGDPADLWHGDGTWGHSGSVASLDDLTDVIITSPVNANRLRYDGTDWRNSNLVWEPMMASDGSVMTDGLLNPMMHEVPY